MPLRIGYLTAALTILFAGGCTLSGTPDSTADGTGAPQAVQTGTQGYDTNDSSAGPEGGARAGPTVVSRAGPQMTATAAVNWLGSIGVKGIAGVVVPRGARLVKLTEAGADRDAHAVYTMPDTEARELREWFGTQLGRLGWGEPTLSDGSLVFRHTEQFSERYARQGLKRTATVHFFDADGDVEFHLIVEEPAQAR